MKRIRHTYDMPFDMTWTELWDLMKEKVKPETETFAMTFLDEKTNSHKATYYFKVNHVKLKAFDELTVKTTTNERTKED